MRQSDYGLDLLGTIVDTQLKALRLRMHLGGYCKRNHAHQSRMLCGGSGLLFQRGLPPEFHTGALLVAEYLADYYRTGELSWEPKMNMFSTTEVTRPFLTRLLDIYLTKKYRVWS